MRHIIKKSSRQISSIKCIVRQYGFRALSVAISLLFGYGIMSSPTLASSGEQTRYVATSGANTGDCSQPAAPCRTIQYAVSQSTTGATILVAEGTYTHGADTEDLCDQYIGTTAVICLINKYVTVLGGYTVNDWDSADPTNQVTILDGEGVHRGVHAVNTTNAGGGITLDGFTVQNGLGRGVSIRPTILGQINAFGGGIYIEVATATLQNLIFQNNRVVGEDTSNEFGGSAAGGALAIHSPPTEVTLTNLTFLNNSATGGAGSSRGGYALGGAAFTLNGPVVGQNLHFEGNVATGGTTAGSGQSVSIEFADAQGGAFAAQRDSQVTLSNVTATNNTAMGGSVPNGDSGGAYGGAIYAEDANIAIYDSRIWENISRGGTGINDGALATGSALAQGGGILTFNTNVRLERISVFDNLARGGDGQVYQGSAGGGGVGIIGSDNGTIYDATIVNSIIAGNSVEFGLGTNPIGGGGGGLWVQGGLQANGSHLTLADNEITDIYMFGEAVVMLNYNNSGPTFTLSDSIIANHTSLLGRNALEPIQSATLNLNRGLLANNEGEESNSGNPEAAITTGLSTMTTANSANFVSAGSPSYDYRISTSSPAKDGATGSTQTVDRNNAPRDSNPDFGAYEAEGFSATVSAVADGTLRVAWNPVAGVSGYTITVTCPAGADAPDQGGCGSPITVSATASDYLLTGLTNYASYGLTVSIADERTESVELSATPTDLFSYLPLFSS